MNMRGKRIILPGRAYPLGSTFDGKGTNFALFSKNAEKVELCLFSQDGKEEQERIELVEYTDETWHCYVPGIRPGQLYGWRVYGKYDPLNGHRFNHNKLLIDPYARELYGSLRYDPAVFGYKYGDDGADLSFDGRDSAPFVPKCVVHAGRYRWRSKAKPERRRHNSVIYELHVKGFTKLHPKLPNRLRGTFAGLARREVVAYLKNLGITAVELMPSQSFFMGAERYGDRHNYWGYNTVNFFTPEPTYCDSGSPEDFKRFVDAFHAAGLEVIMDVVYNHTAEGNQLGPTLSFRGIDNKSYYHLVEGDERYYFDTTGVGNSLDFSNPRVVEMAMDSLRYFSDEMRVDGFRFDLAVSLARVGGKFDQSGGFLGVVQQDPSLQRVKKLAEPWDMGRNGYQLGRFPAGWSEWNDRYRIAVRRFWRGDAGMAPEMATRFCGSSELFEDRGRRPWSSLNYIASHDGFTLADLNAYDRPSNSDGPEYNYSSGYGADGPADDRGIISLRRRQAKNMLATLFLSQGLPMLAMGDECGRTQGGNNNAYLEDSPVSWLDWEKRDEELSEFARFLIKIRARHSVFRRSRFYRGSDCAIGGKDITWLTPKGEEMKPEDWTVKSLKTLVFALSGECDDFHLDKGGEPQYDTDFFIIMNADVKSVEVAIPRARSGRKWRQVFDTGYSLFVGDVYVATPRSFVLLEAA